MTATTTGTRAGRRSRRHATPTSTPLLSPRPAGPEVRAGRARAERAADSPPLGNTADNPSTAGQRDHADDPEQRRRDRRAQAIDWRSRLWSWSSLARLRNCGRVTHTGVGGPVVRVSETSTGNRAGLAGLQSCGSPWACPVCARRISGERSAELLQVLTAVAAARGSAHLVTLTMRHRNGQRLADLWAGLSAGWDAVTSGRQCDRERDRWGVLGWVRVVEVTHGEHGWHLHIHALVTFDTPVSRELASELGGRWFHRWERALARRGYGAVENRGGLDVRPVQMTGSSLEQVADYLAKITAEVSAHVAKDGRDGNRTPFAILRDALATGLATDCELWLEWEQASFRRRQVSWSRDLRTWAGLHVERTDDDIVAEELGGQDTVGIPAEEWPAVRPHVARLLDVAETDGARAVQAWLTARGIAWFRPPARDRPPAPDPVARRDRYHLAHRRPAPGG